MGSSKVDLVERTSLSLQSLGVSLDTKLLIGVSGGPDSLALLHVFVQLREAGRVGEVVAVHINHTLREASDAEQTTVERYAEEWHLPVEVRRMPTSEIAAELKKGIEETARNIRYQFFAEVARKRQIEFVATAHTANDQAETVIMNMMRGSGVRGLGGIPAKRDLQGIAVMIRPWLQVTRDDIENYITHHRLFPSLDESNDELHYQRNRVRHLVMPALGEAYPNRSAVAALSGLARRMSDLDRYLSVMTEEQLELLRDNGGLSLKGLHNLKGFPLHLVLELWINETLPVVFKTNSPGSYQLTEDESSRIEQFLNGDAMAIELRNGIRLRKSGKVLRMSRALGPGE